MRVGFVGLMFGYLQGSGGVLTEQERQTILSVAASGGAVAKSKFFETSHILALGEPEAAAQGLEARLMPGDQQSLTRLGELLAGGVEEIQREVDAFAASRQDIALDGQDTVKDWLRYIRQGTTSEKEFSNGTRDKGQAGKGLKSFLEHENARGLTEAHVVALRLYTTHAFRHINNPLRNGERCPLPATAFLASDAIRKLRALNTNRGANATPWPPMWRGMQNRYIGADFLQGGGTELAFLSTTSDLAVAVRYSLSQASLFFKIVADRNEWLSMGVDVQWLSAFPAEAEIVYPPLTFLQPTGRTETVPAVFQGRPLSITVVEVRPRIG